MPGAFRSIVFARVAFLAIGVPSWVAARAEPEAAVRALESVEDNRRVRCTASFLRVGERCRLVSNAHCVLPKGKTRLRDGEGKTFPVDVIARSARLDLAELSVPDAMKAACLYQPSLDPKLGDKIPFYRDDDVAYRAFRLEGRQRLERYSHDLDWKRGGLGPSMTRTLHTGSHPTEVLREIHAFRIGPGWSGSILWDRDGRPAGVLTRYVPFQNIAYSRPIESVVAWLGGKTPSGTDVEARAIEGLSAVHLSRCRGRCDAGDNVHMNGGDNVHMNGGDNVHMNGGDNVHMNGGDNVHMNGGGPDLLFQTRAQILEAIAEPDEGFEAPEFPGQLLLSVGETQIDGLDDYLLWARPLPRNAKSVLRPKGGELPRSTRAAILKRLDGVYSSRGRRDYRLVFVRDPQVSEGWTNTHSGPSALQFDLDTKAGRLRIEEGAQTLFPVFNPTRFIDRGLDFAAKIQDFAMRLESDAKIVRLEASDGAPSLRCENRHFRKLICAGEKVLFSMSSRGAPNDELHYRLTRFVHDRDRPDEIVVIDHSFGRLDRSPNPARWRRGP